MTDTLTKKERSRVMSLVKSKDTKPEKRVRSMLFKMGYRFRVNNPKLPGKPDIVLKKHKTVIFVHGCFWHSHEGCPKNRCPNTQMFISGGKSSSVIYKETLKFKKN